jgi:hypothetical protein
VLEGKQVGRQAGSGVKGINRDAVETVGRCSKKKAAVRAAVA